MNSENYNTLKVFIKSIRNFTLSTILLAVLMVIWLPQNLNAQCAPQPVPNLCFGGNGPATNGLDINYGQTFWFNGVDTFPDGVNLNGGTLRICGNLTLSALNFTRGNIYVERSGTLTLTGKDTLLLRGNSFLSNSGTLYIKRSIIMSDSNNIIFNAIPAASMYMNESTNILKITSSTSKFINNGFASIHTLTVEDSASVGAVCFESGSCLNLTNLNNSFTNAFVATIGLIVIRYTGNAYLKGHLTNSEDVIICQGTGSTQTGPGTFGNAIVIADCPSCAFALAKVLPIELISFTAKQNATNIALHWATETESQNDYFTIEKSNDGIQWGDIGNIPGAGNSTMTLNYTFQDNQPQRGIQYYRLKQTDYDGRFSASSVISINFETNNNNILVYPNPNSTNHLTVLGLEGESNYTVELKNVTGQRLHNITFHSPSIDLPVLARGIYFLTLSQEDGNKLKTIKYIVQ